MLKINKKNHNSFIRPLLKVGAKSKRRRSFLRVDDDKGLELLNNIRSNESRFTIPVSSSFCTIEELNYQCCTSSKEMYHETRSKIKDFKFDSSLNAINYSLQRELKRLTTLLKVKNKINSNRFGITRTAMADSVDKPYSSVEFSMKSYDLKFYKEFKIGDVIMCEGRLAEIMSIHLDTYYSVPLQAKYILTKNSSTCRGRSYVPVIRVKFLINDGSRYFLNKIESAYQDCKIHNQSKSSVNVLFNSNEEDYEY